MARTAVTVSALSRTGAATAAGTTADPTNDHSVDLGGYPLEEFVFQFTNTNGSDRVATIVAGDNPPALSAGQGNLDITVPATTGAMTVAAGLGGGIDLALWGCEVGLERRAGPRCRCGRC